MKNIKTAFFSLVAFSMIVMAPTAAFALTGSSTGTSAGETSAPATASTGTSAGTVSTPATASTGTSAGETYAPATASTGTSAGETYAPATASTGTSAGTVTTPGTASTGTSAGTVSTPSTESTGTSAGTATPPATESTGTSAGVTNNPPAQPGPGVTGGGSSSSSSSSSGSSILPLLTNLSQCNYLTSYLKIGQNNPVIEVTKLQNFLKNNEGFAVTVNGVFDQQTFNAVSAFQVKYSNDVLSPWGIRHSTGYVYYTTQKKVNELYCKRNFALTPAQVAEIESYRTAVQSGAITPVSGEVGVGSTINPTPGSSITPGFSVETGTLGENATNTTQVGAVAKTSFFSKVWSFIKTIFGR